MTDEKRPDPLDDTSVRRVKMDRPPETHPRRSRRRMIHGTLVAIDAPDVADQPWVVDAVDINAGGMGLVLPESLEPGTEVLLSLRLDEDTAFSRVPAVVLHREGSIGGVAFAGWDDADRLRLLEYLVSFYEAPEAR